MNKTPEEIKQTIILGVITKELKSDIDITRQVNLAKAITQEYAAQCQADNAELKHTKEDMYKMYVQGRQDSHLDFYPEKHAKETYDELFTSLNK